MRFHIRWTGESYKLTAHSYSGGEVVTIDEYEQALAEKDRELELADYTIKECLKKLSQQDKALAEKDREIAKWNELVGSFTQSQHKYMREMEKLKIAHQQLMAQAVRFAQYIKDEFTYDDDPRFVEAEAFLKEREGT